MKRENRAKHFFDDILPEKYFTDEAIERRNEEMKQIRQVAGIVQGILEKHPDTRNSDNLLFIKVVESIDSDLLYKPMMDVLVHAKEYGIPPFESVRRSRQRLQEKFPELRGSKEVEAGREENRQIVRDFVTDCQWK